MRFGVFLACGAFGAIAAARLLLACGGSEFVAAAGLDDSGAADTSAKPTGSFCALEAGTHTFCDDFDGPALSTSWTSIEQVGSPTVAAVVMDDDSIVAPSPPNSLETMAPANPTATQARVLKSFGTASKIVVAFQLRIDSAPTEKSVGTVALGGDSLVAVAIGPNYTVGLNAHAELGYYEDTTTDAGVTQVLSSNDALVAYTDAWTPVVIEVDIASELLSITVGGRPLLNNAQITPPSGNVSVNLGAYQRNEASALEAHYDNVTIDVTQ